MRNKMWELLDLILFPTMWNKWLRRFWLILFPITFPLWAFLWLITVTTLAVLAVMLGIWTDIIRPFWNGE